MVATDRTACLFRKLKLRTSTQMLLATPTSSSRTPSRSLRTTARKETSHRICSVMTTISVAPMSKSRSQSDGMSRGRISPTSRSRSLRQLSQRIIYSKVLRA